jgi:hypothetical protein
MTDETETGSQAVNRAQARPKNRSVDTKPAAQVASSHVEIIRLSELRELLERSRATGKPLRFFF